MPNKWKTSNPSPAGVGSFLLAAAGRAARAMGFPRLVGYTLDEHSGASLRDRPGRPWRLARCPAAGEIGPPYRRLWQAVTTRPGPAGPPSATAAGPGREVA
jgi:hypothetical protein